MEIFACKQQRQKQDPYTHTHTKKGSNFSWQSHLLSFFFFGSLCVCEHHKISRIFFSHAVAYALEAFRG